VIDFTTVIKGNYGEISALAGVEAEVKGVESVGDYETIERTARSLAESTGATVVASGVDDVVADADGAVRLTAGHEMLGEVVGTGCMLGVTVATFCGARSRTPAKLPSTERSRSGWLASARPTWGMRARAATGRTSATLSPA